MVISIPPSLLLFNMIRKVLVKTIIKGKIGIRIGRGIMKFIICR